MLILQTLIGLSLLLAATSDIEYECLPYPLKSMCRLDHIYYHPGEPIAFPTGYDHYQIVSHLSQKQVESKVTILDTFLYAAMHRPSRIELAYVQLESLILPPELHLGNFAYNRLSSVTIEAGRNYQISYLDLEGNNFKDIAFVSRLVNLEVLNIGRNSISTIPESAFAPLTKLKYLYLQVNSFKSIPWTELPRTMVHLDCKYTRVASAEFTNVSLPSLEYLNLQYNDLTTINVTALLLVAPRLKEAHLFSSGMTEHEIDQIKVTLTSNNISFYDFQWFAKSCYDGFEDNFGRCIQRQVGTGMAILLSGVIIGMAALLGYIVVLTFRHMNR